MRRYLLAALALVVVFAAGRCTGRPDPVVRYRKVIVPESVLVASRPDTVIRWRERVVWRDSKPEQVAVAPRAGISTVKEFCAPEIRIATGDTLSPAPDPRLFVEGWRHRNASLEVWGVLNNGDRTRISHRGAGDTEAVVSGDSLIVRFDRWHRPKQWAERALWAGLGYAIGSLVQ